jgi:AraC family transcriptional activator of pobA
MDRPRNCLHYPSMQRIPTYALYGEEGASNVQDWLHWETIQSRSRLHNYSIAPHRHQQFLQVLLLTAGSAEAELDGVEVTLAPPAVVVVPPLVVHGYRFSADVDGIVLTMMDEDTRALGLGFPEAAVLTGGTSTVRDALAGLIAEADRPAAGHDAAMRAHLTLLLVALHRARIEPAEQGAPADRARLHAKHFLDAVDRQYRQTRRIDDYAVAVGISTAHLNRVCRDVLGTSALRIIERRIALEARRQLLFSTLSIKQIGVELGYDDPAYFTRSMTRALGVPPGVFRQTGRGAKKDAG